jgi:hypothetical protein
MRLVVGAPAWDRSWSLPLWFQSVRANVDPAQTGLVFVVPPTDTLTRDAIADLSMDFSWVEIQRDHGPQLTRAERPAQHHETLARARNQILRVVERAKPDRYISWDTDFLVPPGTVDTLVGLSLPLVTVWAWLNRQPPRRLRYFDGQTHHNVLVQDPVCATAMTKDRFGPRHFPGEQFVNLSSGLWRCHVALAFQVMDARAYRVAHYRPHSAGEDIPFNQMLEDHGIPRYCYAEVRGVHLYDRSLKDERAMGWPSVLKLADQLPLAATYTGSRPPHLEALGLYPMTEERAA